MATPTETQRRARGFGAQRFLVRGPDFTSEESLAVIRPRITDYPERYALDPDFPQAGRRGGSRPAPGARPVAPSTGGLFPPGEPGEPGEEPIFLPLYPGPIDPERRRRRINLDPDNPLAVAGVPQNTVAGGFLFQQYGSIPAATDAVFVSRRIDSPFILGRCSTQGPVPFGTATPNIGVFMKVSWENSTAGGALTPGNQVPLSANADGLLFISTTVHAFDIGYYCPNTGWFVKIIVRNPTAGVAFFETAVTIMAVG